MSGARQILSVASDSLEALKAEGFNFFTGVADSTLASLIESLSGEEEGYLPAVREDLAVGFASGAYLSGRWPCVLMQNSGLGVCLNALTSLNLIYKIPVLLIVGYRGYQGNDAPEHWVMGRHCKGIFKQVGIPVLEPDPERLASSIGEASRIMRRDRIPVAILVRPGILQVTTREALGVMARQLTGELVVCTTGYTCRDMQHLCDRPENFYMIGSMGVAASIGLGIALARPESTVVVFDGDGSVLMGLGNLAMIGSLKPKNLIHVVLDNEVFASTGNQPTYSRSVALDALARASGYAAVRRAESPEEVASVWEQIRAQAGPAFFLVKCQSDSGHPMERIRLSPEAITSRFAEAVHESKGSF